MHFPTCHIPFLPISSRLQGISIAFLLCLFLHGLGHAQDSSQVITLQEFLYGVSMRHPIAKNAQLLSETAKQNIRLARGAFDPKADMSYGNKYFKGTQYYEHWLSQLKVPLWVGEFKAGYERNRGENLNPEMITDKGNGLAFAGISVPIGKGLLMNERRQGLRQAQLMADITEAEQVKMLNKLLLDATKTYWNWHFQYNKYRVAQQGLTLAETRFGNIKQAAEQGDKAPIDTVEAKINFRQRKISFQQADLDFNNAALMISIFLWSEDGQPLELAPDMIPESFSPEWNGNQLDTLFAFAQANHPDILKAQLKFDQLSLEKKWALEGYKPSIDLSYSVLSSVPFTKNKAENVFTDNYKGGIAFTFPLLLRKERGKVQGLKIKIEQQQNQIALINRSVANKLAMEYNKVRTSLTLLKEQGQMVEEYEQLFKAEVAKFRNGDSSVFYVNVRESKYLEASQKQYEMIRKCAESIAKLYYAAGSSLL